jgi:hypothetical protein
MQALLKALVLWIGYERLLNVLALAINLRCLLIEYFNVWRGSGAFAFLNAE